MRKGTAIASGVLLIAVTAVIAVDPFGLRSSSNKNSSSPTKYNTPPSSTASKGVYVANFFAHPDKSLIDNPNIDGFMQSYKWSDIESAPGHYDWSRIDADIEALKSANKKIALGIIAGARTPAWASGQFLQFTIAPHNGNTGKCHTINEPVPWDPTFQKSFTSMIADLSAHLRSAGLYDSVTQVKLTGEDEDTEETRLPAETSSITCKVLNGSAAANPTTASDANSIWKDAGYTRAKAEDAWKTFAAKWSTEFPDKTLGAPFIQQGGFPNIPNNGNIAGAATKDTQTNNDLYMWAISQYGKRFLMMNNSLRPNIAFSDLTDAYNHGATIGQQLYDVGFGGTNGTPLPAESEFRAAIDNGLKLHDTYIEVFRPDPPAYASTMTYLHGQLG